MDLLSKQDLEYYVQTALNYGQPFNAQSVDSELHYSLFDVRNLINDWPDIWPPGSVFEVQVSQLAYTEGGNHNVLNTSVFLNLGGEILGLLRQGVFWLKEGVRVEFRQDFEQSTGVIFTADQAQEIKDICKFDPQLPLPPELNLVGRTFPIDPGLYLDNRSGPMSGLERYGHVGRGSNGDTSGG